jgi:cytochrome c-type biogenesis protein CcmH/NrfF
MQRLKFIRNYLLAILLLLSGVVSMSSCLSLVSDIIETDISESMKKNAVKPKGSQPSNKQRAKEAEKLKKQGKCPSCQGIGKSPDGQFICPVCNGTGKYQEKTSSE